MTSATPSGAVGSPIGLPDKDPIDRILIAQAIAERPDFITSGEHAAAYDARIVW